MKKYYQWQDKEGFLYADTADLKRELQKQKELLQNYRELFDDLESPDYVARGNGFCDTKYSENFVSGQIEKIQARIAQIEKWILERNQTNEN